MLVVELRIIVFVHIQIQIVLEALLFHNYVDLHTVFLRNYTCRRFQVVIVYLLSHLERT